MINKEKIARVDIYNSDGDRVLSTKSFMFPKDFFKIRGLELVMIKSADIPDFKKGEEISVVFEYINGTRIRCDTTVDICTPGQLNFHVGEGVILEERRSSFKTQANASAFITYLERPATAENGESEITVFDEPSPAKILNINLGGVLLKPSLELIPNDMVILRLLDDRVEIAAQVLRCQYDLENAFVGYGCKFLHITQAQEEKIARFIFDCQLADRERNKIRGK